MLRSIIALTVVMFNRRSIMRLSQARKKCSAAAVVLSREGGEVREGKLLFAGGWPKSGHAPTGEVRKP